MWHQAGGTKRAEPESDTNGCRYKNPPVEDEVGQWPRGWYYVYQSETRKQ